MLVGVDEPLQLLVAAVLGLARDPARDLEPARLDPRLDAVLVLEPVGDDLELQLADGAEQQHRPGDRAKHLDRAFLAELRQAGAKLLRAQRVGDLDGAEHLRREEREPGELQRFALAQRVAEL